MPELNKSAIQSARFIANPGCFATAIQLAILPLAANSLVKDAIHVNAVTGATGAGTALSATTHFTWRVDNFSHYKAFNLALKKNCVGYQISFSEHIKKFEGLPTKEKINILIKENKIDKKY